MKVSGRVLVLEIATTDGLSGPGSRLSSMRVYMPEAEATEYAAADLFEIAC